MYILSEDRKSRKQWCTGYLAENDYVTSRNRIEDANIETYANLFKEILCHNNDSSDLSSSSSDDSDSESSSSDESDAGHETTGKWFRQLVPLENDAFQLKLSIHVTLLQSTWALHYVFRLEPISLERIHALEVKLRGLEQERSPQGSDDQWYI